MPENKHVKQPIGPRGETQNEHPHLYWDNAVPPPNVVALNRYKNISFQMRLYDVS